MNANLYHDFADWCDRVSDVLERRAPELRDARDAHAPGHFRRDGRVVILSESSRERFARISGTAGGVATLEPGQRVAKLDQLFPGRLSETLALNEDGAEIAADAIAAWLSMVDEEELTTLRLRIRNHQNAQVG